MIDSKCSFRFDYPLPHQNLDSGCQFGADEELFTCGGNRYCRFHLPHVDDDGHPTVKADKSMFGLVELDRAIHKAMGANPVNRTLINLTGVVFPGDFVFDNSGRTDILCYCAIFTGDIHFKVDRFVGNAWFKDARFRGGASFEGTQFEGDARFEGARFTDGASFEGTQFKGDARFEGARFTGGASFAGTQFEGDARFEGSRFTSETLFDHAKFMSTASFNRAKFMGGARFHGAAFVGPSLFGNAEFADCAWFKSAWFKGNVSFFNAQFTGDTLFGNAQFMDKTRFEDAQFTKEAWFEDAQFADNASFDRGHFMNDASFKNARFMGAASFKDVQFKHDADFSLSPPNPRSISNDMAMHGDKQEDRAAQDASFRRFDFSGGCANGVADFSDRAFTRAADFSSRIFAKAPVFHGSDMHQGTNWHGSRFLERKGHAAEKAYRALRLAMEEIRDRPQEAIFFSLEQQTRRGNLPWYSLRWWFSLGYDWTSGYGNNAGLPLLWLAGTTLLFFMFYWTVDGRALDVDVAQAIFTFCVQQIVRPFSIWSAIHASPTGLFGGTLTLYIKIFASLQSVFSLTFLGLFVLALRWQFRRA